MNKKFKLKVTQEIINQAKTSHTAQCMLAQAWRIQYGANSVNVTSEKAMFSIDGTRYIVLIPKKIRSQVINFDTDKKTVKPFSFSVTSIAANPIIKRPNTKKRGYTKTYRTKTAKQCFRRYHGLSLNGLEKAMSKES